MRGLMHDVVRDLAWTAANRWEPLGEAPPWRRVIICLGLLVKSRILGVFLIRAKLRLRTAHVPVLPAVCDRLAILVWNVNIGNYTRIGPGLYLPHGNVVIDGLVSIGARCVIAPFVTIGVNGGLAGPTIGDDVFIGTGAKVLGGIRIGNGARIGANAVVLEDVPERATAAGVPARIVRARDAPSGGVTSEPADGD